jgi:hypothetical protein
VRKAETRTHRSDLLLREYQEVRKARVTEPGLQADSPVACISELHRCAAKNRIGHTPGTFVAAGTVVVIDLWPSQRETSEIRTLSARAVLANVCRKS